MAPTFNFKPSIKSGLEPQDRPWRSFPEYNFVGGHNDPDSLSAVKLAEACNSVILREGEDLATYCLQSGPQGYKIAGISCWQTASIRGNELLG